MLVVFSGVDYVVGGSHQVYKLSYLLISDLLDA